MNVSTILIFRFGDIGLALLLFFLTIVFVLLFLAFGFLHLLSKGLLRLGFPGVSEEPYSSIAAKNKPVY